MGAGGKGLAAFGNLAPGSLDRFEERSTIPGTLGGGQSPRPRGQNALERPSEHLAERGAYPGVVKPTSVYTQAVLNPAVTRAVLIGAGVAALALWRARRA